MFTFSPKNIKLTTLWTTWTSQKKKFNSNWLFLAIRPYQNTGCWSLSKVILMSHMSLLGRFWSCRYLCAEQENKSVVFLVCILSDLDDLIRHGQWKNLASPTPISIHAQTGASLSSLPAYTKEKGESHSYLNPPNHDAGNGVVLNFCFTSPQSACHTITIPGMDFFYIKKNQAVTQW